jgi:hypothetical protein
MKKVLLPILLLVAFGATTTFAQNVNITFELNTANTTVGAGGVFIGGGAGFGGPTDNPMADPDGDGIYTITFSQPIGFSSHYTFLNDNCGWNCKEDISGQACADPNNFNDRFLPGVYSDTTIQACFGNCLSDGTCGTPPSVADIQFNIDMNSAPDSIKNNFTTVYVAGSFNGWSGNGNPMTDNGDGTWSVIIPITYNTTVDSFEYKFQVDEWASQEEFVADGGAGTCTVTSGGFTNRHASVNDLMQVGYCWSECSSCFTPMTISTNKVEVDENLFSINPSLVSNFANIMFSEDLTNQEKQVYVLNAVGQVVYSTTVNNSNQLRIETANYANGMYFVSVQSENVRLTKKFVVSK